MKLNKNIVKKYNKLFSEIVKYYNKSWILTFGKNDLLLVYADNLGYTMDMPVKEKDIDVIKIGKFIIWLHYEYEYLTPFYMLYFSQIYNSGVTFNTNMFNKINEVIEKTRE